MTKQTDRPIMLDIFRFSTDDDGTTVIYQHYAKQTGLGAIGTPVGRIRDGKISWTTKRPPSALVDFGRFAAPAVEDESWPQPCVGCGGPSIHRDSDGEDQCADCLQDTIDDNKPDPTA